MSSEVWYYELLSRNAVIGKSQVYTPYYNIKTEEFINPCSNNDVITREKCVLEFHKPLLTNYRCFIQSEKHKGFTLKELCDSICEEWNKITTELTDWIDKKCTSKVIKELYMYNDDHNITRVIVNFDVPLDSRISLFEEELRDLPFIVNPRERKIVEKETTEKREKRKEVLSSPGNKKKQKKDSPAKQKKDSPAKPKIKSPMKKVPAKKSAVKKAPAKSSKKTKISTPKAPPAKKQKTVNFDELMSKYNK